MNDTGGGVTAIHDVPGDITRIGFHWMLFFPFCHSKGASICSSHGVSRRSRGFFVPRLVLGPTDRREVICEFFLHTENRGDHGFFCPDFFPCPEFANLRIVSSHGVSRMVVGLALHANGGYSSLSIGQYGESVSDDHRSGWNCCLASPEIDVSPVMSSPLVIVPLMTGSPEAHSSLYSSISMMLIVGS